MIYNERLNNNYNFLRLLAATCITFSHSFDLLKKYNDEPLALATNHVINFSFIGLCIFFSCSGYLIAKSADTSVDLKNYLFKRLLRIQPLLIVWCFMAVFLVGFAFTTLSTKNYFSNYETWAYFKNIMPVIGVKYYLPQVFSNNTLEAGVNGSLWTLIVEERLYLLMAFIFLFKKRKRYFFIIAIVLLDIIYMINLLAFNNFKSLQLDTSVNFYALCFLNASLLYFLEINFSKKVSWIIICSFIFSIVSIFCVPIHCLQILFIPVFVIAISQVKSVANKMGKYGDYTYGIYIFSFPIQQVLIALKFTDKPYLLFLCTMVIVAPIAFISWHFFEKKILALKNRKIF